MCKNLGNAWNQRELKWALRPLTFNPKREINENGGKRNVI